MKRAHDLDTKNKVIITNGFAMHGAWFKPPTTPSSSSMEKFLNFEIGFHVSFVTPPLLWDMEDMYGTTKGPHWYLGAIGTIKLDDFIQEFDNWCDMNRCELLNYLHFSWDGKVYSNIWRDHLWMIIMNLDVPTKFTLKNGAYIGYLTMCILSKYLLPPQCDYNNP